MMMEQTKALYGRNICNDDIKHLTVEMVRDKDKNTIFSCIYKPQRGDSQIFLNDINAGDLNLNSLDYS